MRALLIAAIALCVNGFCVAGAQDGAAAPEESVLSLYRAYIAALERGDDAAAADAADQAWRASEARDGDGGRTAVLAFNAATARLRIPDGPDAVEPARRASALVDAGAAGVDPLRARLLLGTALARIDDRRRYREAEALLAPALLAARAVQNAETQAVAYNAAREAAVAAMRERDWSASQEYWESAFTWSDHAPQDIEVARSEALLGRGMSFVARNRDREAHEAFVQAVSRLTPLSPERDDDVVTVGDMLYARARGWLAAVRARMNDEAPDYHLPGRQSLPDRPPICPANLRANPMPRYPSNALWGFNVGAVIVRVSTDSEGRVLQTRVLASIPSENFGESLEDERLVWTLTRSPDAPAGCRMESKSMLVPIRFIIP